MSHSLLYNNSDFTKIVNLQGKKGLETVCLASSRIILYYQTIDYILTCRRFLLPVSVHERAACPGNCLMHPPRTRITFIGCCDHMTSDQPIIALSWLHVVFASLWNLIQWHNAFKEMQYLVNQKNKCFEINLYQAIQFISQHLKGGMSMFQSLLFPIILNHQQNIYHQEILIQLSFV